MYTNIVCSSNITEDITKFLDNQMEITFLDFCRYLVNKKRNSWQNTNIHFHPQTYIPPKYQNVLQKADFTNEKLYLM